MKAVDVIGRNCVELKEFQHSAEFKFEKQQKQIDDCVLADEHESTVTNLRQMLESKMDTSFTDFQEQISRLNRKTETRLENSDKALKLLEADTLWKIKDFEKLLEARPTLHYVKSAMADEGRTILVNARVYTDEEIKKMKDSDDNVAKTF